MIEADNWWFPCLRAPHLNWFDYGLNAKLSSQTKLYLTISVCEWKGLNIELQYELEHSKVWVARELSSTAFILTCSFKFSQNSPENQDNLHVAGFLIPIPSMHLITLTCPPGPPQDIIKRLTMRLHFTRSTTGWEENCGTLCDCSNFVNFSSIPCLWL